MTEPKITRAGKRRQLAGSRKGSAAVRETFDAEITRRRYCQLVEIHSTTLAKWEKRGIVEPKMTVIMNSPTRVFSAADVEFGRALIDFLHDHPGVYSISEAGEAVRKREAGTRRTRV